MRLYTEPDHGVVGVVATAIAQNGGVFTSIDVTESRHDRRAPVVAETPHESAP
ncbi:hypothetical protein [Mumia zhuanghuii]|uniref:hypothetical protein n=1 Tax=Mumia zhuanghuii TaxID=2585211 RepID=UPI00363A69D2